MTSDNNQQAPEPNWEAEYWRERFDRLAAAVMLEDDETRYRILSSAVPGYLHEKNSGTLQVELYICSVCEKPFSLPEGARRPREGFSRFCSDDCRKKSKRALNLKYWHQNKHDWRK